MVCIIIYVIIFIVLIYVSIRIALWIFVKFYHWQHSEIPKLKRGLLKGSLIQKYGKKEGKKLYHETKTELFKKFKIR